MLVPLFHSCSCPRHRISDHWFLKQGAGTITFHSRWWQSPSFPRDLLRDCKSVRKGLLMHSKVMYIRPHDAPVRSTDSGGRCYAYVGSANLSESAW
jgi:phosphatidylserine/phosphatidylglycerophosphate/cardiolipin synthase-like enzyme